MVERLEREAVDEACGFPAVVPLKLWRDRFDRCTASPPFSRGMIKEIVEA